MNLRDTINRLKGWGQRQYQAIKNVPQELKSTMSIPEVRQPQGNLTLRQALSQPRPQMPKMPPAPAFQGADALANKLNAPQPVRNVTRALNQPDHWLPEPPAAAIGSVVGPFKGVPGLIPRLKKGEIGPLYHATSRANAEKIMEEGMLRSSRTVPSNYAGTNVAPVQRGVYLGRFPDDLLYRLEGLGKEPTVLKIPSLPTDKMMVDEDVLAIMPREELGVWDKFAKRRRVPLTDMVPYHRSAMLAPDQQDEIYSFLDPEVVWNLLDTSGVGWGMGTMAHHGDIPLGGTGVQMLKGASRIENEDRALKELLAQLITNRSPASREDLPWWLR